RDSLSGAPDIERALSRLTLGRGGPRDLAAIREALVRAARLGDALRAHGALPAGIADAAGALGHHAVLVDRLGRALAPELPHLARDGGFIAAGYAAALDEQRALRDDSRRLIADLQARYAATTGVASLKIRHNNVLGYYIEVTPTHADKIPTGLD